MCKGARWQDWECSRYAHGSIVCMQKSIQEIQIFDFSKRLIPHVMLSVYFLVLELLGLSLRCMKG